MVIARDGNNLRDDSGTILGTLHFASSENVKFEPARDVRFTHKTLVDICRFIEPMTMPLFQRNPADAAVTRFDKAGGTLAVKVFRGIIADKDHLIGSIGSDALFSAAPGAILTLHELQGISKACQRGG